MTPKQKLKQQGILTDAHHDFEKGLNSYAYFKVSDHNTGEDLVQDTFTKTWSYLLKGGKIDTMKSFLYHILNNLIIDEYRKRKNRSSSLDTLLENGFEPQDAHPEVLFSAMEGKAVLLLINRLPDAYKKVMKMRYVQDLTLKEMSLITGKSKNTMSVQIHRGLDKLRNLHEKKPL